MSAATAFLSSSSQILAVIVASALGHCARCALRQAGVNDMTRILGAPVHDAQAKVAEAQAAAAALGFDKVLATVMQAASAGTAEADGGSTAVASSASPAALAGADCRARRAARLWLRRGRGVRRRCRTREARAAAGTCRPQGCRPLCFIGPLRPSYSAPSAPCDSSWSSPSNAAPHR